MVERPSWRDRFDGRTFVVLVLAGLVGVLAVVPYQFALTGWPSREALPIVVGLHVLVPLIG